MTIMKEMSSTPSSGISDRIWRKIAESMQTSIEAVSDIVSPLLVGETPPPEVMHPPHSRDADIDKGGGSSTTIIRDAGW